MEKIYQVFVSKKKGLDVEALSLGRDLENMLGISLKKIRVYNRYIVSGISGKEFDDSVYTVFAEKNADDAYPDTDNPGFKGTVLITELLPGQFDMRASAAEDCLNLVTGNFKARVKYQRVIDFMEDIPEKDFDRIKVYLINKVEMREGSLNFDSSVFTDGMESSAGVPVYEGFITLNDEGLEEFHREHSLAMSLEDLKTVLDYFKKEDRNPTETEIKILDTYWSDHCRHTTFNTVLKDIEIEDPQVQEAYNRYLEIRKELGRGEKPVTLMDMATIGARYLKHEGIVRDIDESDEINACSIIRDIVNEDGESEKYLIQFKNETHNHPTEIEPFGGAATCLGGAIRDPLSGRAFVYQAMRITGAADPTESVEETLKGKLPQRTITTGAAKGYSSYGNQIGLSAGTVHEVYHPGFKAKRMEMGAVIGSAPYDKVKRLKPEPGDIVLLIGGRTGRDGVGGATGSSKSHDTKSIETSGAEVQKGNAPTERKIQRLMRRDDVKELIKKCNDFGAGGVAVAVGELADGLRINLDKVPLKYSGLTGTETAVSESQERMALLISPDSLEEIKKYLDEENLEYSVIAEVTEEPELIMEYKGKIIADLKRDFLDSAGAQACQNVTAEDDSKTGLNEGLKSSTELSEESILSELGSLGSSSQRALNELFDSSNGAATSVLPFGGTYQDTESSYMAARIPMTEGISKDVSVMTFGYDPYLSSENQFRGAYNAVVSSLAKIAVSGAPIEDVRLSFQEYFEKLGTDRIKWGKPMKSLLGALKAQLDYGVPAIGGKDSMSGTFNDISVPPSLISVAVNVTEDKNLITNNLKGNGDLYILKTEYEDGIPEKKSFTANTEELRRLNKEGLLLSADVISLPLISILNRMAMGERCGIKTEVKSDLLSRDDASFIVEVKKGTEVNGIKIGESDLENPYLEINGNRVSKEKAAEVNKSLLGEIFSENRADGETVENLSCTRRPEIFPKVRTAIPKVLIPVFPGSNCEYDLERAFKKAGGDPEIFIFKNRDSEDIKNSVSEFKKLIEKSHILMLPGGFSAGDEPDGSGKFIGNVLRNEILKEGLEDLLTKRDGLVLGICNGFQALIKVGLVPFGEITEPSEAHPLLTSNVCGKHMDMISRVRISSVNSPWMKHVNVGEIYSVPISHGEGRFAADEKVLENLIEKGQIVTQYCDLSGNATMEAPFNPNGSVLAVEGIISPDGRILGKMGHNERWTDGLYKNYSGNFDMKLFESGIEYFTGK